MERIRRDYVELIAATLHTLADPSTNWHNVAGLPSLFANQFARIFGWRAFVAPANSMKPKITLTPDQCVTFELGRLFRAALLSFLDIENAYQEAGPERRMEFARTCVLKSLELANTLVRKGLRVQDEYLRRAFGDEILRTVLAMSPAPSPLALAIFELREIHSGRNAPLFNTRELGENPYDFLRRYIQAGAAAAIQALHETKLPKKEAAKRVAKALNEVGFINPRGPRYSAETVMDWHKRRNTLKAGFEVHYREWLRYMRWASGRVEQCRQEGQTVTEEQHRNLLLLQISNVLAAFSYRALSR